MTRSIDLVRKKNTEILKKWAFIEGFTDVGISKAEFMEDEAKRLEMWLLYGAQGKMAYMENHFDKRLDPSLLVPGAKSVISLVYNYYTVKSPEDSTAPIVSKYAYGRDYHKVIKKKLKRILQNLKIEIGDVNGRYFVDSAPVMERDWAKRSGLGWIGKNSLLIHPKRGSYFFLAELILDIEFEENDPMRDYCGTCSRCIDACPTDAISKDGYWVDGSRCISYLTIELKEDISNEFKNKMENHIFGCDICQRVCPWNRFSCEHTEIEFIPLSGMLSWTTEDWYNFTEEEFNSTFQSSPIQRTGYKGMKRNLEFLRS